MPGGRISSVSQHYSLFSHRRGAGFRSRDQQSPTSRSRDGGWSNSKWRCPPSAERRPAPFRRIPAPALCHDPCAMLPDPAIQDVLGSPVTHLRDKTTCHTAAPPCNSPLLPFRQLPSIRKSTKLLRVEGMGSLRIREPYHSLTVVPFPPRGCHLYLNYRPPAPPVKPR